MDDELSHKKKSMARDRKTPDFEERKSILIAGLRDVRQRILALASSLPENQRNEIFMGIWSSREMLAHLAGWDETNIKATNQILAGKLPSFYEDFDKDWAKYNASLVSKYIRNDYEELLSLVEVTHRNLLIVIGDIPAIEFWNDRGIRARGWKVMIGRLMEAEMEDEEEHYLQFKRFIESGVKS